MLLTIPQAAERLDLSRQRVHRLVVTGRIKARRLGRSYTIQLRDLERFKRQAGGRPRRTYCAGCQASLTSADREARACTQCGRRLPERA